MVLISRYCQKIYHQTFLNRKAECVRGERCMQALSPLTLLNLPVVARIVYYVDLAIRPILPNT